MKCFFWKNRKRLHNMPDNKKQSKVTIREVAEKAGVSIATTSRVLNSSGYSSEDAKIKVTEAVKKLRYRPHAIARNLKLQRTDTIGLMITDIVNPFYSILASGVLRAAGDFGYHVIVSATDENSVLEAEYLQVLMEERAAGVIAVCTGENFDCWNEAISMGIKVVLVDRELQGFNSADVVLVDNVSGAFDAVSNLIHVGHRRIGIINGPLKTTTGFQRLEGYQKAHSQAGIPQEESLQQIVTFKGNSGLVAAEKLLNLENPPTAIFVANNVLGEAAMFAIKQAKLKIPDDISLVIFDDVPWTSLTNPSISVVRQPTNEIGYRGMQMLHSQLENDKEKKPYQFRKIVLQSEYICRESVLDLRG